MDTIFINSENSKAYEYHVLLLKLAEKLDLKVDQKSSWRNMEKHKKLIQE